MSAVPDEEAVEKLSYLKEIIAAMESYPRSSGDDRILQALQKGLEEVERSGNNFLQDVFHRASDGRSRLTTSVEEQLFPEKGMVGEILFRNSRYVSYFPEHVFVSNS